MNEEKKVTDESTKETQKPLNIKNEGSSPKDPKKRPDSRKILLNLITVVFSFMVIAIILIVSMRLQTSQVQEPKQFSDLISELRKGGVSKIEVSADRKEIAAEIYKSTEDKKRSEINKEVYPNI